MTPHRLLAGLLLFATAGAAPAPEPIPAIAAADRPVADRPNIVIIFMDDMGYGDIGPFGATRQRTPHLDRMAREGMKFTDFYAAPVCSVSRAQLLTGCYGARVSVPGVYFPGGRNGLHPAEHTMAERLRERGYATACIGKWHVGDQPEFLPTRQGFDRYFGIPYSNDMRRKGTGTTGPVVPLMRNEAVEELLTDDAQSRIVERYTGEAVGFIREMRDRPFLLYLAHNAVHTPIHPGAAFAGKSANGRFGDWVEETDWSVGQVLGVLRETGLAARTLVVFTSDNGPWLVQRGDSGTAGPLRGGKGGTWEGGVRVPTLAWWPGTVPAGGQCDAVAGTIDLLPTAVALAGGKVPAEPVIDGRDLTPLLRGQTRESPREAHYYFSGYHLQAVRQGPWKLAIAPQNEAMGRGAPPDASNAVPRLYHLGRDLGERTNVAAAHPGTVARLLALAERMNAEIGGSEPRARRPAGEVAEPRTLYPFAPNTGGAAGLPAVALERMKPGDTLAASVAPRIRGTAFSVSLVADTDQPDAILVAHGGLSAGYAIHRRGGRVAFLVRTGAGDAVTEIVTPAAVASPMKITASLSADGGMRLVVNELAPVTGRAPGLIGRQPQEDFCVGDDNGRPVGTYSATGPFRGTITGLKVSSP